MLQLPGSIVAQPQESINSLQADARTRLYRTNINVPVHSQFFVFVLRVCVVDTLLSVAFVTTG